MAENPKLEASELREWRDRIDEANRQNIFCHCRNCGYEWVDSFENVPCISCASKNVQYILCWQFPDD